MSLYTKIFGENEDATALLGMIGQTRNDFMRYRDVYLNKEGTTITVVARIGGGNRKDYKQVFINMKRNKLFKREFEDKFDNTYNYFEFNVPEEFKFTCKMIAPEEDRISVGEMFQKEIEEAGKPGTDASKRMEMIADHIMAQIEKGDSNIIWM